PFGGATSVNGYPDGSAGVSCASCAGRGMFRQTRAIWESWHHQSEQWLKQPQQIIRYKFVGAEAVSLERLEFAEFLMMFICMCALMAFAFVEMLNNETGSPTSWITTIITFAALVTSSSIWFLVS